MDKLPSTFKLGKMAILLFLITTTTKIPRIYPENLYNLEKIIIDNIQSIYNGNEEEGKIYYPSCKILCIFLDEFYTIHLEELGLV